MLRPRRKAPALDFAIPTINIVFLLLLFFISAGSQSNGVELGVAAPESVLLAPDRLPRPLLTLSGDGRIFLDGVEVGEDAVGRLVAARRAEDRRAIAKLSILAERGLPAHRLLDRIDALREQEALADLPIVIVTQRPTIGSQTGAGVEGTR